MSFIFRAYHAMGHQRPMSNKAGIPTGATFVFVNMLRKLRADFNPQYIAAAFDLAGPTFRDQQAAAMPSHRKFDAKTQTYVDVEYAGYKAYRAETPPDLLQQIPYIRRALDAFRIPIVEAEGYEADDVIGTLARRAAADGYSVFVVSNDKDMMQLVNDRVWVLNPPKDNLICDPAKVQEILGVPPERVIDVMALRGDSVDTVPALPASATKVPSISSSASAASRTRSITPPKSSARLIASPSKTTAAWCCSVKSWSPSTPTSLWTSSPQRWKPSRPIPKPPARSSPS